MNRYSDRERLLERLRDKWSNSLKLYPELEEFGTTPWDDEGRMNPKAFNAWKEARSSRAVVPGVTPPVAPTVGPGGQVYPLTAETVAEAPSFLPWREPGPWIDRAKRVAAGAAGLVEPLFSPMTFQKRIREAGAKVGEELPPDTAGWKRLLAQAGETFKPELSGLEAVQETTAPLRGAALALSRPGSWIHEEEVRKRYEVHRERGLDHVSALAAAYNQAAAAPGEISGFKKFVAETVTDPLELIPGIGVAGSVSRAAARAGTRGARRVRGRPLAEAVPAPTRPGVTPAARAADVDTVFHGTRGGRLESFIDTDGNLVLQPSTNFEGRTVGVSFTRDRATSIDYATRFSAGEGGGAIAARRQRGGFIFEIDRDAIPDKLFVESAEEMATRGTKPVVIPEGRFKASPVDEGAQSALQIFETQGRAGVRALSDRELGERELTSTIRGEMAENAAGGEYSGWFGPGRKLTQGQLDIADRFGVEAVDNPIAPFIGSEIRRRMKGKSPDELTALFKGLAKGAEDLSPADRNAPFFYGPDFETHFRKTFTADVPTARPAGVTPAARAPEAVPTTPVTPAPAGAIPTGRRPPGAAVGPERAPRIMADVNDFDETAQHLVRPDVWRRMANLPVVRAIQGRFNPSAVAKDPVDVAFRAKDVLRDEVDTLTATVMQRLEGLGTQEQIFGKLSPEGLIAEGPLKGLTVNTIRTYPNRYAAKTTPGMKQWIRVADDIEKAKLEYLKANGVEIRELAFEEGGQYAGRRVWSLVNGEGEVTSIGYVGRRFGAKLPSEKERVFRTAEEAVEAGYRYLPDDEALFLNVQGAYYRVIEKRTADWLLDRIDWRTTAIPEGMKVARIAAQQRLALAKRSIDALQRAIRGESLPTGTVNAIERLFPQFEGRLRGPTRVRVADVLKAAKTLEQPERVLEVPKIGAIRKVQKLLESAQERLDADPGNPALQQEVARLKQSLGFIRYRIGVGKPLTLPHNVTKALREDALGDLREMLDAIRGTRVVRPGLAPRFEGGLIADVRRETAEIAKRAARARETAMKVTTREAQVSAPTFAGKILRGPEAKEIARRIEAELAPAVRAGQVRETLTKAMAVSRYFMLGGDMSPMTIQLIFLAGEPGLYAKALGGFVKAFQDPRFLPQYYGRPENLAILQKYPGLKLTRGGTTEFTEATRRGGFLWGGRPLLPEGEAGLKTAALMAPRVYTKVGGAAVRPFARGFEGAMDVAGVELLKSLDHLGTTAARRSDLVQYVNKFRGVTSSARLGVSAKHRQDETLVALAPMYNRAIAALLFDLFHGGLSGSLARRGLARGVGALAAMAVAISAARGESSEEIVAHLTPGRPEFFTWKIAGQNIGPGSKVRSVVSLFGRSVANPEDLKRHPFDDLEYMRNPIIGFGRGLASPGISGAWDILTGEDYFSDPTRDGVLQLTETVAKKFMPIWVASAAFEGGTPIGRTARAGAEFVGLRGSPMTPGQRREEIGMAGLEELGIGGTVDEIIESEGYGGGSYFKELTEKERKGSLTATWQQPPGIRLKMLEDPAFVAATREAREGVRDPGLKDYYEKDDSLFDSLIQRLNGAWKAAEDNWPGNPNRARREYRLARKDIFTEYYAVKQHIRGEAEEAGIFRDFDPEGPFGKANDIINRVLFTDDEEFIKEWTDSYVPLEDDLGRFNWDERNRRMESLIAKFSEEYVDDATALSRAKLPEFEQRRRNDVDAIAETGYWDVETTAAAELKMTSTWDAYKKLTMEEASERDKDEDIRRIKSRAEARKLLLRRNNRHPGGLEELLIRWGYVTKGIISRMGPAFFQTPPGPRPPHVQKMPRL